MHGVGFILTLLLLNQVPEPSRTGGYRCGRYFKAGASPEVRRCGAICVRADIATRRHGFGAAGYVRQLEACTSSVPELRAEREQAKARAEAAAAAEKRKAEKRREKRRIKQRQLREAHAAPLTSGPGPGLDEP